jgi:pimeloyl-ACP methyl ester carboxylesterase
MGPAAEADVVQILRTLKTEYAPPRIFLCGGSMGAASALTFAVLHPDLIDGVAAMNGVANHVEYENFQDAISASFGGNKHDRPAEYKKRSAEFSPERLTMPVGLTVGGKDTSTPPGSVLRLAKALKSLGRCVLLIERPDGEHATNYDDARAILEYVVEKAGKTPEPGK